MIFFYFSKKMRFNISCKLSPQETNARNGKPYFLEKKVIYLSFAVFALHVLKLGIPSLSWSFTAQSTLLRSYQAGQLTCSFSWASLALLAHICAHTFTGN